MLNFQPAEGGVWTSLLHMVVMVGLVLLQMFCAAMMGTLGWKLLANDGYCFWKDNCAQHDSRWTPLLFGITYGLLYYLHIFFESRFFEDELRALEYDVTHGVMNYLYGYMAARLSNASEFRNFFLPFSVSLFLLCTLTRVCWHVEDILPGASDILDSFMIFLDHDDLAFGRFNWQQFTMLRYYDWFTEVCTYSGGMTYWMKAGYLDRTALVQFPHSWKKMAAGVICLLLALGVRGMEEAEMRHF